jgi:hypothetical protein
MVGTIVPVGNGQAHRRGELCLVLSYGVGCMVGGAILGYLLTSMGSGIQHARFMYGQSKYLLALVGAAFLIAGAREVELLKFPLPQSRWQVPRSWIYLGHNAGAFLYGTVLGFALLNPVVCVSFYAVMIWIVLMAGRSVGLALATAYVTGRVLPVLGVWYMTRKSAHDVSWCLRTVDPFRNVVFVLNGILLVGLGSFLLTVTWYR